MNLGARMLRETGARQIDIAKACGVSKQSAHAWANGTEKPGQTKRALLKKIYGIPVDAWDRIGAPSVIANTPEPLVPKPPRPVEMSIGASSPGVATGRRETTEAVLRAQIARAHAIAVDAGVEPDTRLRAEARLTRALVDLTRHTGEADTLTEAKIARHPSFQRMRVVFLKALEPYPPALRAAKAAFDSLNDEPMPEASESA